jgi:ribosome-binding factor A
MSERRRQQVGDLLRDHISEIIQREMRDPRLGFVSITRVDVSADMRMAKVFASIW